MPGLGREGAAVPKSRPPSLQPQSSRLRRRHGNEFVAFLASAVPDETYAVGSIHLEVGELVGQRLQAHYRHDPPPRRLAEGANSSRGQPVGGECPRTIGWPYLMDKAKARPGGPSPLGRRVPRISRPS